ncbi:hypothetical protein QJS66_19885 [Kocuria rhizophila]|nr:hypothetical protein QJS66_19885 [Kocuria rhizophila]
MESITSHVGDVIEQDHKEAAFQYWEKVEPELGHHVREAGATSSS